MASNGLSEAMVGAPKCLGTGLEMSDFGEVSAGRSQLPRDKVRTCNFS